MSPSHRLNPAGTERHADPDPSLAKREMACSSRSSPTAAAAAKDSAAKADADDASPVPAGKSFRLTTSALLVIPARPLAQSRCRNTRSNASPTAGLPSMVTVSTCKPGRSSTVVTVVRAARFIDTDGLAGRLSVPSILPQYLIRAMLGLATAVALLISCAHPSSK